MRLPAYSLEEITHSSCSGKTMWPKEFGSHFFFKDDCGKISCFSRIVSPSPDFLVSKREIHCVLM